MIMTTTNLKTIKALKAFIDGTQLPAFTVLGSKTARYDFVRKTLVKCSRSCDVFIFALLYIRMYDLRSMHRYMEVTY